MGHAGIDGDQGQFRKQATDAGPRAAGPGEDFEVVALGVHLQEDAPGVGIRHLGGQESVNGVYADGLGAGHLEAFEFFLPKLIGLQQGRHVRGPGHVDDGLARGSPQGCLVGGPGGVAGCCSDQFAVGRGHRLEGVDLALVPFFPQHPGKLAPVGTHIQYQISAGGADQIAEVGVGRRLALTAQDRIAERAGEFLIRFHLLPPCWV